MNQQKLKKTVKLATTLITTVIILLVCVITFTSIRIGVLKGRIKQLDELSASLTQQQTALENGIALRETNSYIEQEAREEYGMALPGDVIYRE